MVRPKDIRLIIMTVDRRPAYVHSTLASLLASDPLIHQMRPINLMVGNADADYLSCFRHHALVQVKALSAAEAQHITDWPVGRRFCHNYHRCLSLPLENARGIIVCEDDIVVRDGFIAKLLSAVNEMEGDAHRLSQYLLACYVPYRLSDSPSLRRGRYFTSYHAPTFFGTQCMYYPATVLSDLARHISQDGVDTHRQPGDWIVRDFGGVINGIYGTYTSLAQHVGLQTTGLGRFHSSPTFDDPFPT